MKGSFWFIVFVLAALLGIGAGYLVTLIVKPTLLPPSLRLGSLREPTTILFLGTDVVYSRERRRLAADQNTFSGRSDTIMVARLDPIRNAVTVLSIPRDTQVPVPGHGVQKANSANALGGPALAMETISSFLGVAIDHYVVLNVHGLVELVDKLGGITVEVPKRMHYMDWTAKLKIDLEPGVHTLTGNQAMGFVRFRHDVLGDIGRVQRQEIFLRAVLDKAFKPESWGKLPELVRIGREYVATDLSDAEIIAIAAFVRAVPKSNYQLVMLPGKFSGSGDWLSDAQGVEEMAARLSGAVWPASTKMEVRIVIENASSDRELPHKLARLLRGKGYAVVVVKSAHDARSAALTRTRIIAQRGNPEDAAMVRSDLGGRGEIVAASIGDIESTVTIVAGEDLIPLVEESASGQPPLQSSAR